MASHGTTWRTTIAPETLDSAGKWFWKFLKTELAPYPGRAWTVWRMTIAATIVMLLVMTFRLPSGFLAAIFTLFLSRENPTATLRAGIRTIVSFSIGTVYSIVGIMMTVDDPLTHFLWIVVTLFIAFYLIRIIPDYGTATGFGFMVAGAIPLWDQMNLTVETRVENTLWLAFSVVVGSGVTIVVEYLFRSVHPVTDLEQAIDSRLMMVEDSLQNVASGLPPDAKLEKELALYSVLGTSRLQRLLVRSGRRPQFIAQMNTVVALTGRLVDLSASLHLLLARQGNPQLALEDRERCSRLADAVSLLRTGLRQRQLLRATAFPEEPRSTLPFLPAMERAVALIPRALSGSETTTDFFVPAPMDDAPRQSYFAHDAFSNPAYLQFALRGMLASGLCYVVYTAVDWRGLSTSIATCVITALTTIGSSRQKQFLRLAGAILGGIVFGMGAQIFILPSLDSIAGFTLLFVVVTVISCWIATATPRLSYLGVQLALAFYLINLQEFTIQTSLAIARDRVFGVLLGLVSMWLIFDRLWVRNALDEMQAGFARNLQMFADLSKVVLGQDRNEAVRHVRQLRDSLSAGFDAVKTQSDAVLFEFGGSREYKLRMRDDIRRWQPLLRTAVLMQVTFLQYRLGSAVGERPEALQQAEAIFESDTIWLAHALAERFAGRPSEAPPDLRQSATRLQQTVEHYWTEHGSVMPSQSADVISLTHSLASILGDLADDIIATLASPERVSHLPLRGAGEPAM